MNDQCHLSFRRIPIKLVLEVFPFVRWGNRAWAVKKLEQDCIVSKCLGKDLNAGLLEPPA